VRDTQVPAPSEPPGFAPSGRSSSSRREQAWILRLLSDSLHTAADVQLVRRRRCLTLVMTAVEAASRSRRDPQLQSLGLAALHAACETRGGARHVLVELGAAAWVHSLLVQALEAQSHRTPGSWGGGASVDMEGVAAALGVVARGLRRIGADKACTTPALLLQARALVPTAVSLLRAASGAAQHANRRQGQRPRTSAVHGAAVAVAGILSFLAECGEASLLSFDQAALLVKVLDGPPAREPITADAVVRALEEPSMMVPGCLGAAMLRLVSTPSLVAVGSDATPPESLVAWVMSTCLAVMTAVGQGGRGMGVGSAVLALCEGVATLLLSWALPPEALETHKPALLAMLGHPVLRSGGAVVGEEGKAARALALAEWAAVAARAVGGTHSLVELPALSARALAVLREAGPGHGSPAVVADALALTVGLCLAYAPDDEEGGKRIGRGLKRLAQVLPAEGGGGDGGEAGGKRKGKKAVGTKRKKGGADGTQGGDEGGSRLKRARS
jgi:hypothetical protein